MADPQQPETVTPPTSGTSAPVELDAGQLDSVTGGGEETVILQFGAVDLRHAVDARGQVRLDPSAKAITQPTGR